MSHKSSSQHRRSTPTARPAHHPGSLTSAATRVATTSHPSSVSGAPQTPAASAGVSPLATVRGVSTPAPQRRPAKRSARRVWTSRFRLVAILGGALALLILIFVLANRSGNGATGQAGAYPYAVGQPGLGQVAPAIHLASTAGGMFDLSAQHGKTVLLYFQEGPTCQPCWDQLKDIGTHMSQVHALGIDEVMSVTSDPLADIQQKVTDEGIIVPVLSDPNLAVSSAYSANQYGMMDTSRDGHSFIVVGPDGHIRWRADYGGAPNYTMYVPIPNLLADLQKGLAAHASGA